MKIVWTGKPRLATFAGKPEWEGDSWNLSDRADLLYQESGASPPTVRRLDPIFPIYVIIPLALMGVGLLSSPYWAVRRAKKTLYVLTSKRAVVIVQRALLRPKVRSYSPEQLSLTIVEARSDGVGNLVFDTIRRQRGRHSHYVEQFGFLGIDHVHDVIALIRATLPRSAPK